MVLLAFQQNKVVSLALGDLETERTLEVLLLEDVGEGDAMVQHDFVLASRQVQAIGDAVKAVEPCVSGVEGRHVGIASSGVFTSPRRCFEYLGSLITVHGIAEGPECGPGNHVAAVIGGERLRVKVVAEPRRHEEDARQWFLQLDAAHAIVRVQYVTQDLRRQIAAGRVAADDNVRGADARVEQFAQRGCRLLQRYGKPTLGQQRVVQEADSDIDARLAPSHDIGVPAPLEVAAERRCDEAAAMKEEHKLGGFAPVANPQQPSACLVQRLHLILNQRRERWVADALAYRPQPVVVGFGGRRQTSLDYTLTKRHERHVDGRAHHVVLDSVAARHREQKNSRDVQDEPEGDCDS